MGHLHLSPLYLVEWISNKNGFQIRNFLKKFFLERAVQCPFKVLSWGIGI